MGIDDITEQGYIMCTEIARTGGIFGLSTAYPLHEQNQDILWNEVKAYWDRVDNLRVDSHFVAHERQ